MIDLSATEKKKKTSELGCTAVVTVDGIVCVYRVLNEGGDLCRTLSKRILFKLSHFPNNYNS